MYIYPYNPWKIKPETSKIPSRIPQKTRSSPSKVDGGKVVSFAMEKFAALAMAFLRVMDCMEEAAF